MVLFATQWDLWIGLAVRQVTDDAYVRGDITPLSAQIEGYVRRVPEDAGPCDLWWLATFRRKRPFSDDRATNLGARTDRQVAADKV